MTRNAKRIALTGSSALAIAAALAVASPNTASACTFTPLTNGGVATGVNVSCATVDQATAFATSYGPAVFRPDPTVYTYDGNGDDTLSMTGGQVVQTSDSPQPPRDSITGETALDARFNTIEMGGGNDRINFNAGSIGAAGAPVSVLLGDGLNVLAMTGGTLTGSVFGGNGDDEFRLTGGTITGPIFAGAGNDLVIVDGAVVGGPDAAPDAIGLEDGDDTFDMRSGTVNGAASGNDGSDTLLLSGGTITDFLAGNGGADTIRVSGGAVGGGVQGNEGNDSITVTGGTAGVVTGDEDDDTIAIQGTAQVQQVLGGSGADTVTVSGGTVSVGIVTDLTTGAAGDDTVSVSGGTIGSDEDGNGGIETLGGADRVTISGGQLDGSILAGDGGDALAVSGGFIGGPVLAEAGDDTVTISGDASIGQLGTDTAVGLGAGDDRLTMTGGTLRGDGDIRGEAGNDAIAVSGGSVGGSVSGDDGNDTIAVSGGTVNNFVSGDAGDDSVTIEGTAEISNGVNLGTGNDQAAIAGGTVGEDVTGGAGDDRVTVSGGSVAGDIATGSGADAVGVSGGTVAGGIATDDAADADQGDDAVTVSGGSIGAGPGGPSDIETFGGNDTVRVSGGTLAGSVLTGTGDDSVAISAAAAISGTVGLGDGSDTFAMTGGSVGATVSGGAGDDNFTVSGGTLQAALAGGDGQDGVEVSDGRVSGGISAGNDADTIAVSGGAVGTTVDGGAGTDRITISGTGRVEANVWGGADADTIQLTGGSVAGNVSGEDGNDTIALTGPAGVGGSIEGGEGSDTIAVANGTVDDDLDGGSGDDAITVSGGATGGSIVGGAGGDSVTVLGGTIAGGVSAETVRLSGGRIGGNISGISADTLVIDDSLSAPALDLRDGVVFSGTDAVGTIGATNLAAGGESQNFAGFASLGLSGSTLRFAGSAQGIDALTLAEGSTLFVNGAASLSARNGGFGSLALGGSTLSLIDGDPTDVLTLGGIALDGATIGLDIDQGAGQADTIVANGAATASGANTILVNLVGVPETQEITEIPILSASGAPIGGTFTVAGIGGTPASLFDYEVVQGADGGLFLRATPNATNVGAVTAVDGASASATADNLSDALYTVNNDVARYNLGLAGGAPAPISSSFGVFASGQFAHVEHDGFSISDGSGSVAGPSFSSDDFSGAISLDFNAAKYWGFDQEYGLNLGVFGGYASTDVDLDGFEGYDDTGSARNESGMAGAYALIRREVNYLLLSGTVLFGGTDVSNGVVGSEGDYDTLGYALTASAGHIFVLGERTRFDLRGGVLGVSFKGDGYRDSEGLEHDESKVSFGGVKFEPGIYADYAWENGMVFSPYARAELQQRFSYENESGIEGRSFEFDDADFSGAAMAGANLKISERATLSSEVRGKFSSDSTTFAGKLGLKVAF